MDQPAKSVAALYGTGARADLFAHLERAGTAAVAIQMIARVQSKLGSGFWDGIFEHRPFPFKLLEQILSRAGHATRCAYFDAALKFLDLENYGSASFYAMRVIWDSESDDELNAVSVGLLQFIEIRHLEGQSASNLGSLYSSAIAIRRDLVRAYELYEIAASLGYETDSVRAALAYVRGEGVEQNYIEGVRRLKICLQKNLRGATEGLMECMVAQKAPPPKSMAFMEAYAALARARSSYQTPYLIRCCIGLGPGAQLDAALAFDKPKNHESKMWLSLIGTSSFAKFCRSDPIVRRLLSAYDRNERPEWRRPLFGGRQRAVNLAYVASALCCLAHKERPTSTPWWIEVASRYACAVHGFHYRRTFESSIDIGPLLNDLSPKGVPVGKRNANARAGSMPSADGFSLKQIGKRITAIAPMFYQHQSLYHPNVLNAHDLMVAVGFAFGESSGPVKPSFSLPRLSNDPVQHELYRFHKKVFTPAWFGATEIGKSFYWADASLPSLGLGKLFSLTTYFENANAERTIHLSRFYDDIERAWGGIGSDVAVTQLIELVDVDVSREVWGANRITTVEAFRITHATMRFVGRSIENPGLASEKVTVDGEGFMNGRQAAIASQCYEELARSFPVFARIRLFLALTDVLSNLRTLYGYELAPHLLWGVNALVRWYALRAKPNEPVLRRDQGLCAEGFIKY